MGRVGRCLVARHDATCGTELIHQVQDADCHRNPHELDSLPQPRMVAQVLPLSRKRVQTTLSLPTKESPLAIEEVNSAYRRTQEVRPPVMRAIASSLCPLCRLGCNPCG